MKEQGCFERVEWQLDTLNLKQNQDSQELNKSKNLTVINIESELGLPSLHQANPILPVEIHRNNKYISNIVHKLQKYEQNKLNKTMLPNLGIKQMKFNQSKQYDVHNSNQNQQKQISSNKKQYINQMKNKQNTKYNQKQTHILIYQRINSQGFNKISNLQCQYANSIFLNCNLSLHKSKLIPIYEHLNKVYKLNKQQYKLQNYTNIDHKRISSIQFNSHYESANLFAVFYNSNERLIPTYELYMQHDVNTKGCCQWFNFQCTCKSRMTVRFRIMNFYKTSSLYQKGMKIVVWTGHEWKRVGTAIKYIPSSSSFSYMLQFIYELEILNNPIYFSYGYPYTYSQNLIEFYKNIESRPSIKKILNRQNIAKTKMGNCISLLQISNNIKQKQNKPIIYIIGRQHPGQTPPSYCLQGLINFILGNNKKAKQLRQKFIFKIIPMINIDGVINGNYRSNICGKDINRQWQFPNKKLTTQIYQIKQYILKDKKNIIFFLDLHAHSRKMNSFFYGSKLPTHQNRFYPFICSQLCKFISYQDCSFISDSSKRSTARVVVEKELKCLNSLTFEISYYGWIDPIKKIIQHFKISDYKQIGQKLAIGLYYSLISMSNNTLNSNVKQIQQQQQQQQLIELKNINKNNQKKILLNWKKQISKNSIKNIQISSQGSSLNPQNFQLKIQEQQLFEKYSQCLYKNKQITKTKSQIYSALFSEKQTEKNQKFSTKYSFGVRSPYLMSNKFIRQLQEELRMGQTEKSFSKQNNIINPIYQKSKIISILPKEPIRPYRSLNSDSPAIQNLNNYKQNVLEIKKTLRYCINNTTENDQKYKIQVQPIQKNMKTIFNQKNNHKYIRRKISKNKFINNF